MSLPFLDLYEPLDVIGNGSFGIIRKVRRKTDGLVGATCWLTRSRQLTENPQIFARKELNFERMTERDRKQIVAEVSVLVLSFLCSFSTRNWQKHPQRPASRPHCTLSRSFR